MPHRTALALIAAAALAGCASQPAPSKGDDKPQAVDLSKGASILPRDTTPKDAVPEPQMLVNLTVYRMWVPARSVSHDDNFWKHVDEQAVDPETYAKLYLNGVRVGVAPRNDWEYFRRILENDAPITQQTGSTATASSIEMPVKRDVPEQFITYYHPTNGLVGQTFGRGENSIIVGYRPVPRHPGDVRVSMVPQVREARTEIRWTVRNEARELDFVHPENLFDLSLNVDVPYDNFLVIAPSTEADNTTSVGHTFLYVDGAGRQYETVLLISPQPFRFEKEPATTKPAEQTAAK